MNKTFLSWGCGFAGLAVLLGAFGAHSLKQMVNTDTLSVFETAVRYQMYHSFALIITGILSQHFSSTWIRRAGLAFIIGIVLFSGSLYLLTGLRAGGSVGLGPIGILTPIGGLFFLGGWLSLLAALAGRK